MTNEPGDIRRQIEETQRELSVDMNRLSEKVSPRRAVERRVERARGAATHLKDRIMGTAQSATETVGDKMSSVGGKMDSAASSATGSVSSTASSVGESVSSAASTAQAAVSSAPEKVRRQTQGNPLMAGLVAFGTGWLVASLLPATQRERQVAAQGKHLAQEHAQEVTGPLGQAASQVKDDLRESAQEAIESVRSTARDAGSHVQEQARSTGGDVAGHAQQATQSVRNQVGGG
jgi:hypothetical protein